MARRTYDIPDKQHAMLKRLAGIYAMTQAKMLAYLIEAEWQRSIMDYPKLEENHEKTD